MFYELYVYFSFLKFYMLQKVLLNIWCKCRDDCLYMCCMLKLLAVLVCASIFAVEKLRWKYNISCPWFTVSYFCWFTCVSVLFVHLYLFPLFQLHYLYYSYFTLFVPFFCVKKYQLWLKKKIQKLFLDYVGIFIYLTSFELKKIRTMEVF